MKRIDKVQFQLKDSFLPDLPQIPLFRPVSFARNPGIGQFKGWEYPQSNLSSLILEENNNEVSLYTRFIIDWLGNLKKEILESIKPQFDEI